jgi:hypothetical protein
MADTRRKRRVFQHIMEDESYKIIKDQLPKHWVVREFNHPDYGVDIVIELFDPIDETTNTFENLGEYLYVQVKSVKNIEVKKEKLYPVKNVAKGKWVESKKEFIEVGVIKFVLDTNSLLTVEQTGSSIPFLLFVVDLSTKKTYFICLNDIIDKYIRPKNPSYLDQDNQTLTIPELNELNNKEVALHALKSYGKRNKLLAAFAKFFYQRNEILNYLDIKELRTIKYLDANEKDNNPDFNEYKIMIENFISQIKNLDIWYITDWGAITMSQVELNKLSSLLNNDQSDKEEVLNQVIVTWHSLCNLANMYEEINREWFLPKYLSYMISYPEMCYL